MYQHHPQTPSYHNSFYYASITLILAMNAYSGLVGALILVPIAIAGSIAFIAVKIPDFWHKITTFFRNCSPRRHPRRKRANRSDLSNSPICPDSWSDLESSHSLNRNESARQNPPGNRVSGIWRLSRSSRLTWSFGRSQKSQNLNLCESSRSVQRPLPVVVHQGKAFSPHDGPQNQFLHPTDRHQKAQTGH